MALFLIQFIKNRTERVNIVFSMRGPTLKLDLPSYIKYHHFYLLRDKNSYWKCIKKSLNLIQFRTIKNHLSLFGISQYMIGNFMIGFSQYFAIKSL